ncbi:MAG: hypothetical protein ACFFDT_15940 [Candidatus Hodarchaeota archaeon]
MKVADISFSTHPSQLSKSQRFFVINPSGRFFIIIYQFLFGAYYFYHGFNWFYYLIVFSPICEDAQSFLIIYGFLFLLYGVNALLCSFCLLLMREWARIGSIVVIALAKIFLFPIGVLSGIVGVCI